MRPPSSSQEHRDLCKGMQSVCGRGRGSASYRLLALPAAVALHLAEQESAGNTISFRAA